MTLSSCILITIPVCISAILMQTYFDSRKYKRIPHLIVLLPFLFPTLSHAQYIDNENCRISFKSYENHQGKLEYSKEGIFYQFIPSSNAWKVIIKNNTDETVRLNWKQAGFIVNGRASGVSLYPFTSEEAPLETIKHNREINRTITATNLITENGVNKIYHKKKLRKSGRTSVTIVFPMPVGNKPQFFHTFNFIVTKDN